LRLHVSENLTGAKLAVNDIANCECSAGITDNEVIMTSALLVFACLMGAAGIVLAAASAHGTPGAGLDSAGYLLLIHAATVIGGVALLHQTMLSRTTALIALCGFIAGAALFAADVAARAYIGSRLFPMAAPTGGMILIASWLVLALAALLAR
jgi:uncharacterized membrane protein YgdD (TMEM256/DUF423 family)